jgi:hypothetical protein
MQLDCLEVSLVWLLAERVKEAVQGQVRQSRAGRKVCCLHLQTPVGSLFVMLM